MSGRVLVAMSGGVDSSVAALLLKREGLDVIGVFMRNGAALPGGVEGGRSCCGVADAYDARRVADRLGIPFYVLDFEEGFRRLIDGFCEAYDRGATPNPCIVCNRDLKFGRLIDYANTVGASDLATGHYARTVRRDGRVRLCRGADPDKDQSYVLFPLPPERLARVRFPIGGLSKDRVRALARDAGLPVMDKPESMEICFVPTDDYRALLRERLPGRMREGPMRHVDGRELGRHPGHQYFTVGQRHGLGVALGEPAYVVRIEPESNTVVVGGATDLLSDTCTIREVVWGAEAPHPGTGMRAEVQIRSKHRPATAVVTALPDLRAAVQFEVPQRAVTPGQAAVFYAGDVVIGGGWIETERERRETDSRSLGRR